MGPCGICFPVALLVLAAAGTRSREAGPCALHVLVALDVTDYPQSNLQPYLERVLRDVAALDHLTCSPLGLSITLQSTQQDGDTIFQEQLREPWGDVLQHLARAHTFQRSYLNQPALQTFLGTLARQAADAKVLLVLTDGLDDDVRKMKDVATAAWLQDQADLLVMVAVNNVTGLGDLQQLELGRWLASGQHLAVDAPEAGGVLAQELLALAERTCCQMCPCTCVGLPGPRGPSGPRGGKGVTGSKGRAGDEGEHGHSGEQGPRGLYGSRGMQGCPGQCGPKGQAGAKGRKGTVGPQGPKGTLGESGCDRRGAPGRKGAKGARGLLGYPGAQGDGGERGSPGDKGARGLPGRRGDAGSRGETGGRGSMGPPGEMGPKGSPGIPPSTLCELKTFIRRSCVAGTRTWMASGRLLCSTKPWALCRRCSPSPRCPRWCGLSRLTASSEWSSSPQRSRPGMRQCCGTRCCPASSASTSATPRVVSCHPLTRWTWTWPWWWTTQPRGCRQRGWRPSASSSTASCSTCG
ncbi:collagen alpha-4(VI) chain-like [Athene cunicularia]|uniref:collagen alpha-4(VI) chain-like n=1 Tax=Athene cunicularia TaxID=194338 RepID=UPI000EF748F2|nr:collagen alpha-4(VI) chain-like [Athene cunicularia]